MLRKLSALFDSAFARVNDDAGAREHALRVATALLLIEVARADYADDFAEDTTMLESLKQFFALDDAAAALLLEEARSAADQAVELQQFTRRLHEQLSVAEKHRVVEMLWQVALADQRLDHQDDVQVGRDDLRRRRAAGHGAHEGTPSREDGDRQFAPDRDPVADRRATQVRVVVEPVPGVAADRRDDSVPALPRAQQLWADAGEGTDLLHGVAHLASRQ